MLHYALVFPIVGLIAGALGLAGIAAVAGQIAWILFLIGAILIVVHLVTGRRPPLVRRERSSSPPESATPRVQLSGAAEPGSRIGEWRDVSTTPWPIDAAPRSWRLNLLFRTHRTGAQMTAVVVGQPSPESLQAIEWFI
jgi:uncharacterized membrane protein YtjA (UPF0391 family)